MVSKLLKLVWKHTLVPLLLFLSLAREYGYTLFTLEGSWDFLGYLIFLSFSVYLSTHAFFFPDWSVVTRWISEGKVHNVVQNVVGAPFSVQGADIGEIMLLYSFHCG